MLGAIIGDLAAWTWEHDHDAFYPKLVSQEARLSEMGLSVLAMFGIMEKEDAECRWDDLAEYIDPIFEKGIDSGSDIKFTWLRYLQNQEELPGEAVLMLNVASDIVGGWHEEPEMTAQSWSVKFCGHNEYIYLLQIANIIYGLRHGKAKQEVIKNTYSISGWHHENDALGPLEYAKLAWHCFLDGFDFTSSIHNAMRCPYGNKHIVGALTGALAEAMYGCEFNLLKSKFGGSNWYNNIKLPDSVICSFGEEINKIREFEYQNRHFFPKNSALTNVEIHTWTDIQNPWKDYVITESTYHRILKAFNVDWEHRYGLYLDNGRIYCYRSGVLLCRFRLEKQGDGTYRITDLQKSEDKYRYYGLVNALGDVGVDVCNNRFPRALEYCKYYQGEIEMPVEYKKDTIKGNFWHGEMMFCMTNQDLEAWIEDSEDIKKGLPADKFDIADKLSKEQFAIIIYIEELFRKWCPYENVDWIFTY